MNHQSKISQYLIFLTTNISLFFLMKKVTSITKLAVSLFEKSIAMFCLIWSIELIINFELIRSMCKLTLWPIRAKSLLCEVPTQRTLQFALIRSIRVMNQIINRSLKQIKVMVLVSFSWGFRFSIKLHNREKVNFNPSHWAKGNLIIIYFFRYLNYTPNS